MTDTGALMMLGYLSFMLSPFIVGVIFEELQYLVWEWWK